MQSRKFVPLGYSGAAVFTTPRAPGKAARILAPILAASLAATPAQADPRQANPGPFDPHLFGSALDHLTSLQDCAPAAADPKRQAEARNCIRRHLAALPPEERRVLAAMAAFTAFFAPPETEDGDGGDVGPLQGPLFGR